MYKNLWIILGVLILGMLTLNETAFGQKYDRCQISLFCNPPITQHIVNSSQYYLYWSIDDDWQTGLLTNPVWDQKIAPLTCTWINYSSSNKDSPAIYVNIRTLPDKYADPAICQYRFIFNAERQAYDVAVTDQVGPINCTCSNSGQLNIKNH